MDDLLTIVEENDNLPNVTLDFDALRAEGTAYIAQLGHRLWTDFNVHDPGITMLEVLCYAINDLAFRASFPMQDLLAEPGPSTANKQFYTAAEILSCCPVTPLDYRKLIIDVEGVKNAWIFKAGAEGKNFYRQYFLLKTEEDIAQVIESIDAIREYLQQGDPPNVFPVAASYCDFLAIMDRLGLPYGEVGRFLFDCLTYEIKACAIKPGLNLIDQILEIVDGMIADGVVLADLSPAELYQAIIDILSFEYVEDNTIQCAAQVGLAPDAGPAQTLVSDFPSIPALQGFLQGWTTVLSLHDGMSLDLETASAADINTALDSNGYTSADFSDQVTFLTGLSVRTFENLLAIQDFLQKIIYNNNADQYLGQITLVVDALYDGEGELTTADLGQVQDFVDKILDMQFSFITNDYYVEQYAQEADLNTTIANGIITALNSQDSLQSLAIVIDITSDLESAASPSDVNALITSALELNGYDPADFSIQITHLTALFSSGLLTADNLAAMSSFLNQLLSAGNIFVLSDQDFAACLEAVGITDPVTIAVATQLVKDPADNACIIREDLDSVINVFDQLCALFPDGASLPVSFGPQDTIETVLEKIRTLYLQSPDHPNDAVDQFLASIEPFLWIFTCQFDGIGAINGIKEQLESFFTSLAQFQQAGQIDFTLEGEVLYNLIDEAGLAGYLDEVLGIIKGVSLPGFALIGQVELQIMANFFGLLAGQDIGDTLDYDALCGTFRDLYEQAAEGVDGADAVDLEALAEHFCELCICWRIIYCDPEDINIDPPPAPTALNGLFNVCLDLESHINPEDILTVEEIIAAVREKLCAYRNLGEDGCDIDVVGRKPICIDVCITAADEADANEVKARAIYQIREFLASCPQFYSLQEMLGQGLTCDEIFQGPILDHGFLSDEEIEQARLRRVVYKSDLYQEIMNVEGVVAVSCLKIQLCNEEDRVCAYENEWCLDICQREQAEADLALQAAAEDDVKVEKYDASITCKHRPELNLEASNICIQKDGVTILPDRQDVLEKLELLELLNRRPPVSGERDIAIPMGVYRNLDNYTSIQDDFPLVYHVGKDQLSSSFTPKRKALAKQLKAYLTFFDQLLANYLAQLRSLKDTLSVCPEVDAPVLQYGSVLGLDPGIDELFFQVYRVNDDNLEALEEQFDSQALGELSEMRSLPALHRQPFLQAARETLSTNVDDSLEAALLRHCRLADHYTDKLEEMVENGLERFQRRNKLLDHMIARFGEQFSDYALSLYNLCPDDPCKAAKVAIKDNLLRCKTEFLKSIPLIGSHRAKGFNYKADDCVHDELFWHTDNVAGMKKRVSRLLCLESSGRVQLACPPKAIVVKDVDEGRKCFSFVVVEAEKWPGSPDAVIYLRGTREYTLRSKGKRELNKIRKALLNANRIVEVDGQEQRQLEVEGDGPYYLRLRDGRGNVVAESEAYSLEATVTELRDQLAALIFPDDCKSEGFHIVEHILLRPPAKSVPSLNPIDLCGCKVKDPYSFWITVVALDQWKRFTVENGARDFFEQMVRRETPAHIGICFLWLDGKEMNRFEEAYKNWLYDLARQESDDCQLEESITALVNIMNELLVKDCPDPCQEEGACCCP